MGRCTVPSRLLSGQLTYQNFIILQVNTVQIVNSSIQSIAVFATHRERDSVAKHSSVVPVFDIVCRHVPAGRLTGLAAGSGVAGWWTGPILATLLPSTVHA